MNIIPLFVAIPLGGGFLIPMVPRKFRRMPDILGNLATIALLVLSFMAIGKSEVYKIGGWSPPIGINLVLDGLSVLILVIINLISFLATLFSIRYMELYTSKSRYYSLFLLMVAGMNGVALSGDLFNLFVFLEIASVASYALVAFGCQHEELEASFKYLVLSSMASTLVLFGIALTYGITGSLNMADVSRIVASKGMNSSLIFASMLFLMGFGLKSALVPFHAWLPDAHPSAPAPISAMLSGVLIKVLGVYAILRVFFNVFGITEELSKVLMYGGAISMVFGAFLAIGQWDLKRLLAYSSISQVGYVILGVGIGGAVIARGGSSTVAALAILGGLFHLLNHATFKSMLFFCSGSVEYSTGTRDLRKMGGLAEKMPLTGTVSTIGTLSISGIPPFNGFWSKLIIIVAAIRSGYYGFATVAILVSVITLIYYLKAQRMAFFGDLPESLKDIKEIPALMGVPMVVLALLCIGMGLLLLPDIKETFLSPAVSVLTEGTKYVEMVLAK